MDGVTISGADGEPWAHLAPGDDFRVGRGGDGVDVDRSISASPYVSGHACTIVATEQSYWVENWARTGAVQLLDVASRSQIEVLPGVRRLSPFASAVVRLMTVEERPSGTDAQLHVGVGQVEFAVRCDVLAELETLAGRQPSDTQSWADEVLRKLRSVRKEGGRLDNVRQWYACLALCEPLLRDPAGGVVPSHAQIARRIAPLVDRETGTPIERRQGEPATSKTISKRLFAVRDRLHMVESIDGSSAGLGDTEAPTKLAHLLTSSGAITLADVEFYLRRSPSGEELDDVQD